MTQNAVTHPAITFDDLVRISKCGRLPAEWEPLVPKDYQGDPLNILVQHIDTGSLNNYQALLVTARRGNVEETGRHAEALATEWKTAGGIIHLDGKTETALTASGLQKLILAECARARRVTELGPDGWVEPFPPTDPSIFRQEPAPATKVKTTEAKHKGPTTAFDLPSHIVVTP